MENKIIYNDYWERVQEKDDEIERLNNIINEGINKCEELANEIEEVEGAYSSWFLEIEEILKGSDKE